MKEIISPVDTEDGLFHDGDPSTGTEGTVVSEKWLNPVQGAVISSQQEMASVLKEAGIKIDPSKQDQLLAAIKKITGTATEGYLKVGDYGFGGGPQHKTEAYSTVAQIYRINSSSTSPPGGSVYGVICLPCDGAPSAGYLAAGINGELHVGRSTTVTNGVIWNRVYTTECKPTAADINTYTKQEADARFAFKSITVNGRPLSSNVNLTAGDVNAWNKTEADGRFLLKSLNLGDLPNKTDSRYNLDVYSKGETQTQASNIAQQKANTAEDNAKKWASDNCYNQFNQPPAQSKFTMASWYWADVNNRTNRIIQGGSVSRTADIMTVTFPIAFPLGCVSVMVTQTAQNGVSSQNIIVQNVTKTSFDIVMRSSETQCYWMAVGA